MMVSKKTILSFWVSVSFQGLLLFNFGIFSYPKDQDHGDETTRCLKKMWWRTFLHFTSHRNPRKGPNIRYFLGKVWVGRFFFWNFKPQKWWCSVRWSKLANSSPLKTGRERTFHLPSIHFRGSVSFREGNSFMKLFLEAKGRKPIIMDDIYLDSNCGWLTGRNNSIVNLQKNWSILKPM